MSCVGPACFSLPRRGGGSGPCSAMNPLPHLLRNLFPALLQMSLCIFRPLGSAFTRVPHGHRCSRSSGELGPSSLDFIVHQLLGLGSPFHSCSQWLVAKAKGESPVCREDLEDKISPQFSVEKVCRFPSAGFVSL